MQFKLLKLITLVAGAAVILLTAVFLWRPGTHHPMVSQNKSDGVSVAVLPSGEHEARALHAGYQFVVPTDWRVEPIGGESVAVYPLGDSAGVSDGTDVLAAPRCKLELSAFPNASGTPLVAWISAHLHEDPTVTVARSSLETRMVADVPAIEWAGTVDDREVVLVYVANNSQIYEIAPSSLDATDVSPDHCVDFLDEFLGKLQLPKRS